MTLVAQIVYFAFNVYALGLVAWVLLAWAKQRDLQRIRAKIDRYYGPPVNKIRTLVKPLEVSGKRIDFSPLLLLIAVLGLRWLVVSLLITPF